VSEEFPGLGENARDCVSLLPLCCGFLEGFSGTRCHQRFSGRWGWVGAVVRGAGTGRHQAKSCPRLPLAVEWGGALAAVEDRQGAMQSPSRMECSIDDMC
jgi:hypothetical protein